MVSQFKRCLDKILKTSLVDLTLSDVFIWDAIILMASFLSFDARSVACVKID
ncbi:hypothetical protein BGP_6622 [Beggiatoa sp. PS]|nr:hypothetical protein BGP_6622 [Beggiatoa sp. PS]